MVRVQAKQVPLLFAFHEKYTQNLAKDVLIDMPYHNCGQYNYLLNFADYITGCLSVDCYSKYIPAMRQDVFKDAQQFLEYAVVNHDIQGSQLISFNEVLTLFQIECCSATVWLNTFVKENFRKSCGSALQSSENAKLKNALSYADKVNTIRIIPTLPQILLNILQESEVSIVKNKDSFQQPSMQQVLTVIGWLTYTYGAICLQDTNALLNSLVPDSCLHDDYSLYMFNTLRNIQLEREGAAKPIFTRYAMEEI